MKTLVATAGLAAVVSILGAASAAERSDTAIDGRWDAALIDNGPAVPFRLDISGAGPTLKGTFYDGFKPYDATTSVTFKDGKLVLKAEHYLTTITAELKNGELVGETTLVGPGYSIEYGFPCRAACRYRTAGRRGGRAQYRRQLGNPAGLAIGEGREGLPAHRSAARGRSRRVHSPR